MINSRPQFDFRKIAHIATTSLCLLCFIPQQGFSATSPIQEIAVSLAKLGDKKIPSNLNLESAAAHLQYNQEQALLNEYLADSFKNLATLIEGSADSHTNVRQFFQSFINQINAQRETSLTIEEACSQIRQNLDSLPIPTQFREHLLLGLDLMNDHAAVDSPTTAASLYWPWEWSWFGLNKKDKAHHHHKEANKLSTDEWKIAAFGLFCCAVVLVAVFAPTSLVAAIPALGTGAQILL